MEIIFLGQETSETGEKLVKIRLEPRDFGLKVEWQIYRPILAKEIQELGNTKYIAHFIRNEYNQLSSERILLREKNDPQLFGEIFIPQQAYDQCKKTPCIFCKEIGCVYFYFRESFYKFIEFSLLYIDNHLKNEYSWSLELIENKDDIFMPGNNSTTKNFNLAQIIKNRDLHINTQDWYLRDTKQFEHEAKVRNYVLNNKGSSVKVHGKEYQLNKDSFRINYDPQTLFKKCKICSKDRCTMTNYLGVVWNAVSVGQFFQIKYPHFIEQEQLLVLNNWTENKSSNGDKTFTFKHQSFEALLPNKFYKLNFIHFFFEHLKAHTGSKNQVVSSYNFCSEYFCCKVGDKRCGRCQQTWYCSAEHQKIEWIKHKIQCNRQSISSDDHSPQVLKFQNIQEKSNQSAILKSEQISKNKLQGSQSKNSQILQPVIESKVEVEEKDSQCSICRKLFCEFRDDYQLKLKAKEIGQNIRANICPNFQNDDQLLVEANWFLMKNKDANGVNQFNFKFGAFNFQLPNDYAQQQNLIPFMLEHVKAFSGFKKKQVITSSCNFCAQHKCFKFADKKCGKCKQVWYCSFEHQKLHWPKHKISCQIIQTTSQQAIDKIDKQSIFIKPDYQKPTNESNKIFEQDPKNQQQSEVQFAQSLCSMLRSGSKTTQLNEENDGVNWIKCQICKNEEGIPPYQSICFQCFAQKKTEDCSQCMCAKYFYLEGLPLCQQCQSQVTQNEICKQTIEQQAVQSEFQEKLNDSKTNCQIDEDKKDESQVNEQTIPENKNNQFDDVWEDLKQKQNLLISYQNVLTPEQDQINQSVDAPLNQLNLQENVTRCDIEEIKEPQDDGPKQQPPTISKTTPQPNQDQLNDLEERISNLEMSKFLLQKENLEQKEKINRIEQECNEKIFKLEQDYAKKFNRLEKDQKEKELKMEQEQFEIRQQLKLLSRKFNQQLNEKNELN